MNNAIAKGILIAATLALNSECATNHGAVVLYRNRIVGRGFNSKRTNWLQRIYAFRVGLPFQVYEHAEFAAMRGVDAADTMIVIRVWGDEYRNSMPCTMCRKMIEKSGIKHLYYSNEDGGITYERI